MINLTLSVGLANRASRYEHIRVRPATGSIGAVVGGVDLRDPTEAAMEEIQRAIDDHLVLVFEDQTLEPADQQAFSMRFGELGDEPFVDGLADHPKVIRLVKEADEKSAVSYGGAWHTDWSFLDRPPSYSLLYAKDIPAYGGDTVFANTRLAYELLSDTMKALLAPLAGIHSAAVFAPERSADYFGKMENMSLKAERGIAQHRNRTHPLVRTHARTSRKALYLSPGYTVGIEGMPKWESEPLLSFLFNYCTDPLFCYRHHWQPGMLVMWDNRCTLHRLVIDYHGFRREMHRTTVLGETPA